jgi:hypothetical protein
VRLGEEKGAEGPPLRIELLGLVPEAEEHLLDDLLGHALVDQQPAGEREDRPRMTAVCLGERILSPPPDRDDNGCITDLP